MKPKVVVAPSFRRMDEVFDKPTLSRLDRLVEVIWGRDGPMPRDEFDAALRDATAVVFGTWQYGIEAISQAGANLRYIFEVAGSHGHRDLDYRACLDRGIAVGSCAHAFGPAVAEMALALSLSSGRQVAQGDAAFRRGEEKWLHEGNVGAVTMWNKTVGFVGAGGLSVALQQLLEPFEVRFLGYDPWLDPQVLLNRNITPVELPALFAGSDVIYVLAAPAPENHHLVSGGLMGLLQPHQTLVIISRAHLVDFEAMTDLVLAGRFRAAIDVFPDEPFDPTHRIRKATAAVFSAHRAGAIPEALFEIGRMVVDDIEQVLAGEKPQRMQYATADLIDRLHPLGGGPYEAGL